VCFQAELGKVLTENPKEFELNKDIYVSDCQQPPVESRNEMFTKIKLTLVSFKILLTHRIKNTCVISSVNAFVIFLIIVFYRPNHAKIYI
jgi:hypothetical protein